MTGIDVHRGQVRLLETDNRGGISPFFLISYQACSFHFIDFHNFQFLDSENIAVSSTITIISAQMGCSNRRSNSQEDL